MGQSNLENRKEVTRGISDNILEKIFVTDKIGKEIDTPD